MSDQNRSRAVRIWLLSIYLMVLAMVLVGGITRLTGSGLSMVEWRPLMGTLPPLSEGEWQRVFGEYKKTPQYQQVNKWMKLADFQRIFFWEYLHRLLGRLFGVVFLLPWIFFLATRRLRGPMVWRSGLVFVLGGAQGLLGWYMVKSGLVSEPSVSHYRLAAHLLLAFLVAGWVLWLLFELRKDEEPPAAATPHAHRLAIFSGLLLALVLLQVVYGAFMAGSRAGFMYATFPTMNGEWMPSGLFSMSPFWRNLLENPIGIHFWHRMLGYALVLAVVGYWFATRRSPIVARRKAAHLMLVLVLVQLALGIATVLNNVQIALATAHQAVGFLLYSANLYAIYAHRAPARDIAPPR